MARELKAGHEMVIFSISSLYAYKSPRYINHCNVLVCRQLDKNEILYTLFEPAKINGTDEISFVKGRICLKFRRFEELHLAFGEQEYGQSLLRLRR